MAQNIEDFLPPIQSAGLNTLKNVSLGGTLAVTGASTFTGAETFNGAATFNSTASFATSPTFSGGRLASVVNETTGATLTISQSGSTVVFTQSLGTRIILPAPQVGATYTFVLGTTPTSGTHGIVTNSGSVFLLGSLAMQEASGALNLAALANGTSTLGVGLNGTTTGGIAGSEFSATAISSTVWETRGTIAGSGTLATPFI